MQHRPIIFDFDGVIVDSEVLANKALALVITDLGFPTTTEEAIERYTGYRMSDCIAAIEARHDFKVPNNIGELWGAAFKDMHTELQAVPGAVQFVRTRRAERTAIASSSRQHEIERCLAIVGLFDHFTGRIFSAANLERGKPHPDVFWLAAEGISARPQDCIVIEDGTLGTQGAVAAGMTVIGLTAGSHCTPTHAGRLRQAGAHHIAKNYEEVAAIIAAL